MNSMDYYYYDDEQLSDNELDQREDYEYDSVLLGEETFTDLYKGCIKASTVQVQQYIMILLGCGLLHRVLWELIRRMKEMNLLFHLISISCGLLSLWLYVGSTTTYVLVNVFNICSFLRLVIAFKVKHKGLYLCLYTIGCQVILECLMGQEMYETIRGPQMVVSMKLISVAFDIQDFKESFAWIPFIGYLCSPTTFILGPWTSFRDYIQNNVSLSMKQLLRLIVNIVLSVTFLNLSNCIIPWLKHIWNGGLWWRTYLDALSVRCSHYFICYLSHATLLISRYPQSTSNNAYTFRIVQPLEIEFPRSLSVVIRNWNIPMHLWLKRHVFQRIRAAKYSYFSAILVTYLVSCLVHGFNYKVHLILMSLGVFSYFENSLRRTLARTFNACIESMPCKEKQSCKYLHCQRTKSVGTRILWGNVVVRFVNFLFSLIVIIQLAYLGVMLNSNSAFASSPADILQVWSHLKYFGHWLASAMALFYVAI